MENLEKSFSMKRTNQNNSIRLMKSDGGTFNITIPGTGDEYYVLQSYKVSEMESVPNDQR